MQARWRYGTMYGEAMLRGDNVLGDMPELKKKKKAKVSDLSVAVDCRCGTLEVSQNQNQRFALDAQQPTLIYS
jgi:hypothetical protein